MKARRKPKVRKSTVKKSMILAKPKQEISHKKDLKPWIVGIIIVIFIGSVLYFNSNNQSNITGNVVAMDSQQGFKQGTVIWKKGCFLDGLAIKDDASNIFACNTDDYCLNIIKEYHGKKGTPPPPQELLEKIKCLTHKIEVTE